MPTQNYNQCSRCTNYVEPRFFDGTYCHFCKKQQKWEKTKAKWNVYVELSINGHWRAFLRNEFGIYEDYIIASGQIPYSLVNAKNSYHHVAKIIRGAVIEGVTKHYKPDRKYQFEGDVKHIYLYIDTDELPNNDLVRVIELNKQDRTLPTLVLKTFEYHLWTPQVNFDKPYSIGTLENVHIKDYNTGMEVSDVIKLVPESIFPYRPAYLQVLNSNVDYGARYMVEFNNHQLDVVVKLSK